MAQDPIQLDSIKIAPSESGTRIIDYDPVSKSIRIQDPNLSSSVNLISLSGLRSVQNTFVVGKSGSGATYTTLQEALDAVPASASMASAWTILVLPGVYSENLLIEKNAVTIFGLGGVILQPAAVDSTILVQSAVGSSPEYLRLQNLRIENSNAGKECIKIVGSSGSTIGELGIFIQNCEIVASGIGSYQLYADAVNDVFLNGGSFGGSDPTSLVRINQLHRFVWKEVEDSKLGQLDYSSGGVIPSLVGSSYKLSELSSGNLQSTLSGAGSLEISNCSTGNLNFLGDQVATIRGSSVGTVTCNGTSQVNLIGSSRGIASGTGILVEEIKTGSVGFAASALESVTFDVDTLDVNYGVSLDYEIPSLANVKLKSTSGFDVEFSAPQTGTVYWTVHRRV